MKRLAILLCVSSILFVAPASAETIKIVVPFAAGGPVDQLARILAPELSTQLGADVIVENRGGAGGALGSEQIARAAPDGNTMLLASLGSQVISPTLKAPSGYDPKAFVPIMLVGSVPSLLVVSSKLGISSLKDLITKAKAGPAMSYGSAGPGTTMNIAAELFNSITGIKTTHVPYRGAGPALNDLLGGHLDIIIADFPALLPLVRSTGQGPRPVRHRTLAAAAGCSD
jgi:tripartite-type tricarboxylate transporter receptor subunit TctC